MHMYMQVIQGDLGRWLLSKGYAAEEMEDLVDRFMRPEIEVKDLLTLFALDPEDIEKVLEGLPLGKRKVLIKHIQSEQ